MPGLTAEPAVFPSPAEGLQNPRCIIFALDCMDRGQIFNTWLGGLHRS